jgi:hypothetical protein
MRRAGSSLNKIGGEADDSLRTRATLMCLDTDCYKHHE